MALSGSVAVLLPLVATIGWGPILVVLVVVLLLFGGKKLPELARSLGRSMRVFRAEMHGLKQDIEEPSGQTQAPKDETKSSDHSTEEKK